MAQPFLTDQQILGQTPETAEIARQRKIADLLTSQAFNQPQGGMVSGRYVAPSIAQQLQPLASALAGSYLSTKTDEKADALAKALRQKQAKEIEEFTRLQEADPGAALGYALSTNNPILQNLAKEELKGVKLGEGEVFTRPRIGGGVSEMRGAEKFRAPIQVDTGTSIEFRDPKDPTKVLQVIPKSQMPTAGQVVETANGPMLVNTRTGQAQPIMAGGEPLAPKLTTEQQKDVVNINQQKAVIGSALDMVQKTPTAFSFKRGLAGSMPLGETLAGRTEKPEETEARAAVFNIVSKVINERAGAAQSAQEISRLNKFLPSEYDNADQIKRKLTGFMTYLNEQEQGTRAPTNKPYAPGLSPQDQEALNWANSNPNDPRAAQIKQRLGR